EVLLGVEIDLTSLLQAVFRGPHGHLDCDGLADLLAGLDRSQGLIRPSSENRAGTARDDDNDELANGQHNNPPPRPRVTSVRAGVSLWRGWGAGSGIRGNPRHRGRWLGAGDGLP